MKREEKMKLETGNLWEPSGKRKAQSGKGLRSAFRVPRSVAVLAATLLIAAPVSGNVILGQHDWDTDTLHGWASQDGWTTVAREPTGGVDTTGWMSITFTNDSEDPGPWWYDTISTPKTNLFAGSWTSSQWIEFDFWASNTEPSAIQVQFGDTATNLVWRYDVFNSETDDMALTNWTTYTASFANWEDWKIQSPGYTENNYLANLDSIDWIGVYIYRNTAAEQIYGIDNFMLMIPEPVECLMLAAAAISSAMSLRKKKKRKG